MQNHEILFQPDGTKIKIEAGVTLTEAAQRAGIVLDSICGGVGTCNKCLVEVAGLDEPVRACQYTVDRDMTITIPQTSRFFEQKILEEGISLDAKIAPAVCKHYIQPAPPTLQDLRSDAERLTDAVNTACQGNNRHCKTHTKTSVDLSLLGQLPVMLRQHDYAVTAVCHKGRIIAIQPGDTSKNIYGLAVDIGTTTVVARLIELTGGNTLAVASQTNPQVTFGDDVISRIEHTRINSDGLQQLHLRITKCINQLISQLCDEAKIDPNNIYELTAAGNATMQHLLLAIPVQQIAQAPYVSAFSSALNVPAKELGIKIHPQGNIYVLPSVAAHIGGDTVAVTLSAAMRSSEKINLAIDIGTNGEVVLGNCHCLLTCSTAAGPAFEGARISCGMRGATGAIERVHIKQDLQIAVIGGGPPIGICGSGLLDAIAELLNVGLIDNTGRLLTGNDIPETVPPALCKRIITIDNNPAFVLAHAEKTKHGKPVLLTQRDIRETQLGKAAIHAGIIMLINQMKINAKDIDRLYLAGAFGNYIRPESALRIGMLPDIPLQKIHPIGNAAGAGAREVLLSQAARQHAEDLARNIQYVELAGRPEFQNIYSDCMFFPEK